MDNIQQLRQEIDSLDKQIVELLGKRFKIIRKVAEFKKENNIQPLQQNRWNEVLSSVKILGQENGLSPVFVGVIWNTIHEFALGVEENI